MGALYKHLIFRQRPDSMPMKRKKISDEAIQVLGNIGSSGIDEYQAKKVLRAYGIPTTNELLAISLEEAKDKACEIGYPVVLKICSPHISHKTELGMVRLNLDDEEALVKAFHSLREKDPDSPMLVAEMIRGDRELMAGMSRHPGFPPCIMFGLGGVLAEALSDFSIRLAPLSRQDALEMMDRMATRAILGQYRGMVPVDKEALVEILVSLGQLALHFPQIREIDLNPIIVVDGKPKVADALMVI
jgi:acetyltransferase